MTDITAPDLGDGSAANYFTTFSGVQPAAGVLRACTLRMVRGAGTMMNLFVLQTARCVLCGCPSPDK
jgi:hypothetical protein